MSKLCTEKILLIPSETAFFSAVVISSDIFKTVAYVLLDSHFCLTAKKRMCLGTLTLATLFLYLTGKLGHIKNDSVTGQ